ncbi:MAG: glycosyltransferase [Bacteroidia bacterium]|nr:glycosyltransferase [Bacteroidia bacterium]MBT8279635.1 glycosyltransferase [Bacteroidia bacterium]NND25335.1 glycosyltransferase [Flavobacteriaceae bacterium]NNK59265.1 glycosyltransferase [Flavobacteriaceae bacterium]NNL32249.1 glycosyltransferase [Flavobacteriaceae bacterium]
MISILIPTFNFNTHPLAKALERQALKANIVYELICIDDGSFSHHNIENQKINNLSHCKFIEAQQNIGRNANRHLLAKKAQYDWLLFIDSDVLPKTESFLVNYLDMVEKSYDAIFGGFAYADTNPEPNKTLRYTFGKHREEVSAAVRNKKPYKVIISANFLIKKDLFLQINKTETKNLYGLDYLFGGLLSSRKCNVHHIDNEVYHLGIDTNENYLEKTRKAVETLYYINNLKKLTHHEISMLSMFQKLKLFGLHRLFGNLMANFNTQIEKNLLGKNPNLFLFDIYRLGYLCRL